MKMMMNITAKIQLDLPNNRVEKSSNFLVTAVANEGEVKIGEELVALTMVDKTN